MFLLKKIDSFLNGVTMYKLVLFGLFSLAGVSIIFASFGLVSYSPVALALSFLVLTFFCYTINFIFEYIYKAPSNIESTSITSLILFLILPPLSTTGDLKVLVFVSFLAIASKYLLAFNKRHIFNPAAFALVVLGISGLGVPLWWVGTTYLLPFTIVFGLLVVRKIRRFQMFFVTVFTSVLVVSVLGLTNQTPLKEVLTLHFTSWPIVFFASIMVTEPLGLPPRKYLQIIYGIFIGAVSSWPFMVGPFFGTPELALILGNLLAYSVSLKRKLFLFLQERVEIAKDTYEFVFKQEPKLVFLPGQYLEWTLPHKNPDVRGVRRYFTIASSPTEETLKLGVKFAKEGSSFKKELFNLSESKAVFATQLSGDFVLPKDQNKKLVFVAGGIGITPFRSMLKYLLDTKQKRNIVLFYSNKTQEEIAYKDLLEECAKSFGLKTVFLVTDSPRLAPFVETGPPRLAPLVETGFLDQGKIEKYVPDFKSRVFYLSGPNAMVENYKTMLLKMGVGRGLIVTDYFPGFA